MKSLLLSLLLGMLLVIPLTMEVAATPPNVRVNSVTTNLQNEEQIWISPFNANIVIANWRDWRLGFRRVGVGRSTNGGANWQDSLVSPIPNNRASDPCLTGDRLGNFYMNMLNYSQTDQYGTSRIVVYKSTNDGVNWTGPFSIQEPELDRFEDKQFTTVDRTGGPYDGYYYCSWTRFPNPTRIIFARSTNGGSVFPDTVLISGSNFEPNCGTEIDAGQFSIPIVDANGNIHVLWQGRKVDPGCVGQYAIRQAISTDGGATFSPNSIAFLSNMGYYLVDGNVDTYGMPNGDADISAGLYNNTIYIVQTQMTEGYFDRTDVVVRKSTDGGTTWSNKETVNDDPNAQIDQFHPWLVVNEDGVVLVIFYDQRDDPVNHTLFNAYYSASFDGGETYVHNMRVSDVSSNPAFAAGERSSTPGDVIAPDGKMYWFDQPLRSPQAGLFAEYIGIHANHDTISTIWTDTRGGNQDAYSARFLMPFMKPRLYLPLDGDTNVFLTPALKWSTCWHEGDDNYRIELSQDSTFATVNQIINSNDNNYTVVTPLDSAKYFWRVKAFRVSVADSTVYSEVFRFGRSFAPTYMCGDADGNDGIDISDAVYLIQYIFQGGPAPAPLLSGDADCSGIVDISDAVYLIQYIFSGGPVPCSSC